MKPHFAFGLFALYVVAVSLFRVLGTYDHPRLTAMKKQWGRSRGIALHFISNVALPLVLGIIFIGRGAADFGSAEDLRIYVPIHHQHALHHLHYRPPVFTTPAETLASGEIAILLASSSSATSLPTDLQSEHSARIHLFPWDMPPP